MLVRKLVHGSIVKNFKLFSRGIISSLYPDVPIVRKSYGEYLFSCFDKHSNKIALIDDSRKISYSYDDLKKSTISIASALVKKGLLPGSVVGIIASNSPEYLMLIIALSSMGCTVTVCNQNYTENELLYQLTDAQPTILFTNEEYVEKISNIASKLSNVKSIYLIGSRKSGFESVDDLLNDSGNMNPIGQLKIDLDNDVGLMPYSSGTTGLPKGVMLSHSNMVAASCQISTGHYEGMSVRFLLILPLYHIYAILGITSMAFFSGTTMVVQPSFNPVKFLSAIDHYKINVLHVVPPLILFLLNHPDVAKYDLSSVWKIISGGSPMDSLIEDRITEKFRLKQPNFGVYQGYGLTETGSASHTLPSGTKRAGKQGTIGLLVPNMQCKIVNALSRMEVAPGESGELLLRGPNIMKGYFNKPIETKETFEDEWLKTGDIVHCDDDQYFFVVDRIKDLIKVKGYQVSPTEIENALLSFPGIADCAVIGVPDEKHGEVPKAFVVKNKDIKENEIHEYMNGLLSPYKQLHGGINFVQTIPRNPSGKTLRNILRSK